MGCYHDKPQSIGRLSYISAVSSDQVGANRFLASWSKDKLDFLYYCSMHIAPVPHYLLLSLEVI
jgi:hypothetical protein